MSPLTWRPASTSRPTATVMYLPGRSCRYSTRVRPASVRRVVCWPPGDRHHARGDVEVQVGRRVVVRLALRIPGRQVGVDERLLDPELVLQPDGGSDGLQGLALHALRPLAAREAHGQRDLADGAGQRAQGDDHAVLVAHAEEQVIAALARADGDDLQGLVQAQADGAGGGAQAHAQGVGSHQAVAVRLEAHGEVVVEDVDVPQVVLVEADLRSGGRVEAHLAAAGAVEEAQAFGLGLAHRERERAAPRLEGDHGVAQGGDQPPRRAGQGRVELIGVVDVLLEELQGGARAASPCGSGSARRRRRTPGGSPRDGCG